MARYGRWSVVWVVGLVLMLLSVGCAAPEKAWHEVFDTAEAWRFNSDAAATVDIVDGRLTIHVLQPGVVAWAASEKDFTDFDLQVEATLQAGPWDNEYGVLVHMDGDQSFYAFSISGDGYARVARYENGVWTPLASDWMPCEAISMGEAINVLHVKSQGGAFTFSVNDEVVIQVTDAALTKGGVGLYAGAFDEPGVLVSFDNLDVLPLE